MKFVLEILVKAEAENYPFGYLDYVGRGRDVQFIGSIAQRALGCRVDAVRRVLPVPAHTGYD